MEVQLATGGARLLLGDPQPALVVGQVPIGMDARLDAELGRSVLDRLTDPFAEAILAVGVGQR